MPKQIEYDGEMLEFDDGMSDEEILRFLNAQAVAQVPPAPLGRAEPEFPEFPDPRAVEAAKAGLVEDVVAEEVERAGEFLPAEDRPRLEAEERMAAERALESEVGAVLPTGDVGSPQEPADFILPFLRASRITMAPEFRTAEEVIAEQGPVSPEVLAEEQRRFPTPLQTAPVTGRQPVIFDQETGEARVATAREEFVESFARQPVLTELEAATRGQEIRLDPEEEPLLSGLVTERVGGQGTVETELGALMRGPLGALSSAVSDVYFRGLGYEVDEQGVPKDPEDFGLWVAEQREKLGLPEVITFGGQGAGTGFVPIPLPGVAVDPSIEHSYDPEGRRAPSDSPEYVRRVSRNLASGRGLGDEFAQSPAVRQAYADIYGDPDAAFWGGTFVDLFMPTGFAGMGRVLKEAGKLGVKASPPALRGAGLMAQKGFEWLEQYGKGTGRVKDVKRQRTLAESAVMAMRPDLGARGAKSVVRNAELLEAVITPGRKSDGVVMRRVAERLVPTLGLNPKQEQAMVNAIRASEMDTPTALVNDLPFLNQQSPRARRFAKAVELRTPDDLVMVTEKTAVPRVLEGDVRKHMKLVVGRLFDVDEAEWTKRVAKLAPDSKSQQAFLRAVLHDGDDVETAASINKPLRDALKKQGLTVHDVRKTTVDDKAGLLMDWLGEPNLASHVAKNGWDSLPLDDRRLVITLIEDKAARTVTGRMAERYARGEFLDYGEDVEKALDSVLRRKALVENPNLKGAKLEDRVQEMRSSGGWQNHLADLLGAGKADEAGKLFAKGTDLEHGKGKFKARNLNDVSDVQVYLDDLRSKKLFDSPFLRRLLAAWTDPSVPVARASVSNMEKRLQTAGTRIMRDLGARLEEKAGRMSYERAIDEVLAEEAQAVGKDPESLWVRILGEMYGTQLVEGKLRDLVARLDVGEDGALVLLPDGQTGRATDFVPTVKMLRETDNILLHQRAVPRGSAPTFDRAMVKVAVEEGIRQRVAREIQAETARRFGVQKGRAGADPGVESLFSKWARESTEAPLEYTYKESPAFDPTQSTTYSWVTSAADNPREREIMEEINSVIQGIDRIPVKQRGNFFHLAGYRADATARAARDTLHGMKYGFYGVPNVFGLFNRAAALPVLAVSTVGAGRALDALGRSAGRKFRSVTESLGARRMGGGLETVNGAYYSPRDLERLWQESGGAVTAIEAARRGTLAEDILASAEQASKATPTLKKATYLLDPRRRGYWQRTAEAVELSFRRSVFESALADGVSPAEAGELSRIAVLDYGETLTLLDDLGGTVGGPVGQVAGYFASSAEDAALTKEAFRAVGRNPAIAGRVLKAQVAQQRAADPERLQGDKALKAMGVFTVGEGDDERVVYGPQNPLFTPIETAIGVVRGGDWVLSQGGAALEGIEEMEKAGLLDQAVYLGGVGAETARGSVEGFSRAGLGTYAPAALAAWQAGSRPSGDPSRTTIRTGADLTDEQVFWGALLLSDLTDPTNQWGTMSATRRLLDPEVVPPPKEYAIPVEGYENFWAVQPPLGTPYLFVREDEKYGPLYQVYKPSKRGLANLKAIRKATPDMLGRALGVGALWSSGASDRVVTTPMFPEGGLFTTVAATVGELGGPVSPEVERARQAEAILRTRTAGGELAPE